MEKSTPILRIHQCRHPRICHFDMIFEIIADHYLIFGMLFMQLRGKLNPQLIAAYPIHQNTN
jgi:hypothetical protein